MSLDSVRDHHDDVGDVVAADPSHLRTPVWSSGETKSPRCHCDGVADHIFNRDRYFDDETCRLEPIENPFGPKVLPLRSE